MVRIGPLGQDVGPGHTYSDYRRRLVDSEVKAIVAREGARSREVLMKLRESLSPITHELVVKETLQRQDLEAIVAGSTP